MVHKLLQKTVDKLYNSKYSDTIKIQKFEELLEECVDQQEKDDLKEYWQSKLQLGTPQTQTTFNHPDLIRDKKGAIMTKHTSNLFISLKEYPKFKGTLSFNELNHSYYYKGKEIQDLDFSELGCDLSTELQLAFKKEDIINMSELVASKNKFHPVRDYLDKQVWDGKDRIPALVQAFNIKITDLDVAVWRNTLIGAVARIYKPASKNDSIIVIQGRQGTYKSTGIKLLCPDPEWFCDEHLDFTSKDSKMVLIGKWIVELAELSSLNKKENNIIRSELTHTVDEFRRPYDRKTKKYARQFIYIGTTNENEFLTDTTGNRRFWVVQNQGTVNLEAIVQFRDQLWAQAVHLFKSGEKWHLNNDKAEEMAEIASQFEVQDIWKPKVESFLEDKEKTTTIEVLKELGSFCNENKDKVRVQKIMQQLRWESTTIYIDGKYCAGWKRPTGKPLPVGKPIVPTETIWS